MKKLKIVLLVVLVLSISLVLFACNPGEGDSVFDLQAIEGFIDASVDNANGSIVINTHEEASITAKIFNFNVEGVTVELFQDEDCNSPVSSVEIKEGTTSFYLRATLVVEGESLTKVYSVQVVCTKQGTVPNPDDSYVDDSLPIDSAVYNYVKPSPSTLTKEQLSALIRPYAIDVFEAFVDATPELTYQEVDESLDIIVECFKEAGLTYQECQAMAGEVDDATWQYVLSIFGDENTSYIKMFSDAERIEAIADIASAIVKHINPNTAVSVLETTFLTIVDYSELEFRNQYLDFSTKELATLLGNANLTIDYNLMSYYDVLFGDICSNSGVYVTAKMINGAAQLEKLDGEEFVDALTIVSKLSEEGISGLFNGTSTVSIKDVIRSVNYVGSFLNDILDGVGNVERFDEALSNVLGSIDSLYGTKVEYAQMLKLLANKMETLTSIDVVTIFEDYDDYAKESNPDAKMEKLGYLVVDSAHFLKKGGAKVTPSMLAFIGSIIGPDIDEEKAESVWNSATAKEIDAFTKAELKAIGELLRNPSEYGDGYEVFNIYGTIPVFKNSTEQQLKKAVISNSYYQEVDFDEYSYTLSAIDENTAYVYITKGSEKYRIHAYIIDPSNRDRYVVAQNSTYVLGGVYNKNEAVNNQNLLASLDDSNFYVFDKTTEYFEYIDDEYILSATLSNFTSATVGRRVAVLTVNFENYGSYQFPYVYEIVDSANPIVTDLRVDGNNSILVGDSIDALSLSVEPKLNYSYSYDNIVDECEISGFDSSKPGYYTLTVKAHGLTKAFPYQVYSVQQFVESSRFEFNYANRVTNEIGNFLYYEVSASNVNNLTFHWSPGSLGGYYLTLSSIDEKLAELGYTFTYNVTLDQATDINTLTMSISKNGQVVKTFKDIIFKYNEDACDVCGQIIDDDVCEFCLTQNASEMFDDFVTGVDNLFKPINEIYDEASINAEFYVRAEGSLNTDIFVKFSASLDERVNANNWMHIELELNGTKLYFFMAHEDGKENMYLGQNLMNDGGVKWSKIDWIEDCNSLRQTTVASLLMSFASIRDTEFGAMVDVGILSHYYGQIIDLIADIGFFVPVDGDSVDFTTQNGYEARLDQETYLTALTMLSGVGFDPQTCQLIEAIVGVVFNVELDIENGTCTSLGDAPIITFKFDLNDEDVIRNFELSYATQELDLTIGLANLEINADSKGAVSPVENAEDLAFEFNFELELPRGIAYEPVAITVVLNPNIKFATDENGSLSGFDAREATAYALAEYNGYNYVVAEYNVLGDGYLYLDLTLLNDIFGLQVINEPYQMLEVNANEVFANVMVALEETMSTVEQILTNLFANFDFATIVNILVDVSNTYEVGSWGQNNRDYTSIVFDMEALMEKLLSDTYLGSLTETVVEVYASPYENVKTAMTVAEFLEGENVVDNLLALLNTRNYEEYVTECQNNGEYVLPWVDWINEGNGIERDRFIQFLNALRFDYYDGNLYEELTVELITYANDGIGCGVKVEYYGETASIVCGVNFVEREGYVANMDYGLSYVDVTENAEGYLKTVVSQALQNWFIAYFG